MCIIQMLQNSGYFTIQGEKTIKICSILFRNLVPEFQDLPNISADAPIWVKIMWEI